jgi:sigma54-dependent transcription regulator
MPSQIEDEIGALFDFMQHIYGLFGFDFHLELSTRPDNYLGTIETWNAAEEVCFFFISAMCGTLISRMHSNSPKRSISITRVNGKLTLVMEHSMAPR